MYLQLMCGLNPSLDDFSSADIADAEVQQRLQQVTHTYTHTHTHTLSINVNVQLEKENLCCVFCCVTMFLFQLQCCTDGKLLSPSLCDWASSCGIPGIYSAGSDQIPAIYVGLVKHCIYNRYMHTCTRRAVSRAPTTPPST